MTCLGSTRSFSWWRRAVTAAGFSVGLMLAAGCGSGDSSAEPTDAASAPSSTSSTTSGAPATSAPLNAAGVDPCALLDDDVQGQLGVTDHGPADNADFNGATCRFVLDDQHQLNATATDGATLAQLVEASKGQGRTTTPTSIRGYDAALSYSSAAPTTCTAAIGVSSTGMLVVTYQDTSATSADEDHICGQAHDIADHTVDGLISQQ